MGTLKIPQTMCGGWVGRGDGANKFLKVKECPFNKNLFCMKLLKGKNYNVNRVKVKVK